MCVFPACLRAPADRRFDWVVVAVASGGGSASSSRRRKARRRIRRRKLYTSGGDGGYGEEDGDDEGDDGGDDESDEDGEVELSDFSGEFSDAEEACESVGYVFGAPRSAYENAILSIRMEVCLDVSTCRKRHEITPPPLHQVSKRGQHVFGQLSNRCFQHRPSPHGPDTLPSSFENSPAGEVSPRVVRGVQWTESGGRAVGRCRLRCRAPTIYRVFLTRVMACARPSHTCRLPCRAPVTYRVFFYPCYDLRSAVAHISAFFFLQTSAVKYTYALCLGTVFFLLCAFCVVDPARVVSVCCVDVLCFVG